MKLVWDMSLRTHRTKPGIMAYGVLTNIGWLAGHKVRDLVSRNRQIILRDNT